MEGDNGLGKKSCESAEKTAKPLTVTFEFVIFHRLRSICDLDLSIRRRSNREWGIDCT